MHRVIERCAGDANTPGLRHCFQARGDVYPVTIDIVSVHNDVAEIDPNAEPERPGFGGALIRISHATLDRRGTLDRIYDAGELDERTIAHQFDYTAAERFYRGVNHFPTAFFKSRERADLILSHEAAITNHVGGQNSG
jgi:hypothetical protein